MKNFNLITYLLISCLFGSFAFANEELVPYPDNYRNWTHIKSMLIEPGHTLENPFQGIHHVYGNSAAIQGLKKGKYSNGATFVFDLLDYIKQDNTVQESGRKLIGVMVKDSKKYKNTGGWGFEGFAKNSKTQRLTNDGGSNCFTCHSSQVKSDYVFSKYRK